MSVRKSPIRRIPALSLLIALLLTTACADAPDRGRDANLANAGPVGLFDPAPFSLSRDPATHEGEGGGSDDPLPVDPTEHPGGELGELLPPSEDDFLVKLRPGTDPYAFVARLGLDLLRVLDDDTILVFPPGGPGVITGDYEVLHAEPNQPVILAFGQDITMGFFEGVGFSPGKLRESKSMQRIGHEKVHPVTQGAGQVIGIVDTGADPTHPLLSGRVQRSTSTQILGWIDSANREDDDGDGEIDEAYGHGTMIAGIIAQVAPATTMIPVRALNSDGVGSLADILTGIDALYRDGVDVVNLSLSLSQFSPLMEERMAKLREAGIAVVAASGNQGSVTAYPARSSLAIGVAASETDDALARFSNAGPDCELSAPGVDLFSAFPQNRTGFGDGTSFAAPVVSAAIALLRSVGKNERALLAAATALAPLAYGEIQLEECF